MKRTIVCLCGSTRFMREFREVNRDETLAGKIVLLPGVDMKADTYFDSDFKPRELERIKADLDQLHLDKIDMADEVLVLNVDGYVGDSTRRELIHAIKAGKPIRWLEPDKAQAIDWKSAAD